MPRMVSKIVQFIDRDIWRLSLKRPRNFKSWAIHTLRILVLSKNEFAKDQCLFRASALTYYSLLSIVPVFAMAFGVAKGFGLDKLLREKIMENMRGQQEVMSRVLEFSENFLQNTKGGIIAGIGLALLFWTIIQVLSNIETSFNAIWGIKKSRTLGKKFTDYLAFMLVAPVVFIMTSSASVFIISQVQVITTKVALLGVFAPLVLLALKLVPYLVFSGLLTFLYIFLPNGKIQFRSAFIGGLVAGAIYQVVQWAYIHFQIGASNAGAIYGTFAALPLFLVWLQTSWLIVLYGAELAFAHQNEDSFLYEKDCLSASHEFKTLSALLITHLCVQRFTTGQPPLTSDKIADTLELPIRLTRESIDRLITAGVLSPVKGSEDREILYQPARDIQEMTVQFVIERLHKTGSEDIPLTPTPELEKLRESLRGFNQTLEDLPENFLLKDLNSTNLKVPVRF